MTVLWCCYRLPFAYFLLSSFCHIQNVRAAALPLHPRNSLLESPENILGVGLCSTQSKSFEGAHSEGTAANVIDDAVFKSSPNAATSEENIGQALLRNLFKGLTIPFPSLRKLVLDTEKKKNLKVGLGIRESVAAVVSYVAVGVASYHFVLEPSWSLVDAMYFTVTCFTTVGYGDLVPTNLASKAFTCVFGLAGISFLGAAIATMSGSIIETQVQAVQVAKTQSQQRFKSIFEDMPEILKHFKSSTKEQQDAHFSETRTLNTTSSKDPTFLQKHSGIIFATLPSLFVVFSGGAVIHKLNGGTGPWWDAIYYSVITASTIGLGDISPMTRHARMAAIVYIPLAVAAAGELLSGVATSMMERRQQEVYKEQFENSLTIKKLKDMDSDGSGRITRAEYIKFMLIEMGMVDDDELDELDKQFDRLDKDHTGYLDKEDLSLMAKYRGVDVEQ